MSLALRNGCFNRAGREILKDVSLDVAPGSIHALIGPNGAGKSSILKVMSGEWQLRTGSVTLGNIPLPELDRRALARTMGVLPQTSKLEFDFTANEVVELSRVSHKTGHETNTRIVGEALAAMDALDLSDRSYLTLSGGEKQRIQLARVMAQIWPAESESNDAYLLLDEPTTALDPKHELLTRKTLRKLAAMQIGILVVLHDINYAAQIADTITVLKDGEQLAVGTPTDVITSAVIGAAFDVHATIGKHPNGDIPHVLL